MRGSHGYDPSLPSMQATFIAHGPAFRRGTRLPAFDNVDVYPLLMRLLGLTPAPNDGSTHSVEAALTRVAGFAPAKAGGTQRDAEGRWQFTFTLAEERADVD